MRQARYRAKPEVRLKRRAHNLRYYRENQDRLRTAALARYHLRRGPRARADYPDLRLIRPGDPIPVNAGPTTRNACRTGTAREFMVEAKTFEGSWELVASDHELSMLLGVGPRGYNEPLKEFVRSQLLVLYPLRYSSRSDLPTEETVRARRPWDARERDRRLLGAELKGETIDLECPHCSYFGPFQIREAGPHRAADFPEDAAALGVAEDEQLLATYCPSCTSLVHHHPSMILKPAVVVSESILKCECGFDGRPEFDLATDEFLCPNCLLVVGQTMDDRPVLPSAGRE